MVLYAPNKLFDIFNYLSTLIFPTLHTDERLLQNNSGKKEPEEIKKNGALFLSSPSIAF